MDKQAKGDIWCAEFGKMVPENAELVSEVNGIASYMLTPQCDPGKKDEVKLMKNLTGTIMIDTVNPAIAGFRMTAPKPFKPAMVAKVDTFDLSVSCDRAPDGRTYAKDFKMSVKGSAMMQSFEEHETRRISGLRQVGP